jgi:hypothetical protein
MHSVFVSLIEKLPPGYLMVLTPVLLACGIWLFTRIRRDKHGKMYFYSQKYEDSKRNRKQDRLLEEVSKLTADMVEMKKFREDTTAGLGRQNENMEKDGKRILQLQICSMNLPATAKREAYREYKTLGLNSWVDEYVVKNGLFTRDELLWAGGGRSGE